MYKKLLYIPFILFILFSNACAEENIKSVIDSIYKAAQKKDISYFKKHISSKEQIIKIMDMISKSDMPLNYKKRIKNRTADTIHLDYHWLEKSLHFQIILKNKNSKWVIDRIFRCR